MVRENDSEKKSLLQLKKVSAETFWTYSENLKN